MPLEPVAIGFRDHTGWAIAVVLRGPVDSPAVVRRERLPLLDPALPAQVYHAIAEDGAPRALLPEVVAAARAWANAELARLVRCLRDEGYEPFAAAVPAGWQPIPRALDAILASHPLLHAAEGELYREALAEAATGAGLRVARFAQRDLHAAAGAAAGFEPSTVASRTSALGRGLGPPWQKDHKEAAAAAWIALASGVPSGVVVHG